MNQLYVDHKLAEAYYLRAMRRRYSFVNDLKNLDPFCYEMEEFEDSEGPFSLVDNLCVGSNSSYIDGMMAMYYQNGCSEKREKIWVMHCIGEYEPDVLSYLYLALMATYGDGIFCGGRGFEDYDFGVYGLYYSNWFEGSFVNGKGTERIGASGHIQLGCLSYSMRWRLPIKENQATMRTRVIANY